MEWKKDILIGLLLLCVGILLGMMAMRSCQSKKQTTQPAEIIGSKTKDSVVVIIDTFEVEKPIPYKGVERDTIYITDTLVGSVLVQETKEYIHPTFYARVSGINAYLQEMIVYPKTEYKYITTTNTVYAEPKKWAIAAGGEYERLGNMDFARVFGEVGYTDRANSFYVQAGNEVISRDWFIKFGYKRYLYGKGK